MEKLKRLSLTILVLSFAVCACKVNGQILNQQNVNINLPVIEKKVYIDRYRTVYVQKPRVARKLAQPVQLMGYLWVYPEDLGNFKSAPTGIIANINSLALHGRDNWRIPTPDELAVLEANADKIGLGDDIYLATDHRNGVLRLVATGISETKKVEEDDVIVIGGVKWAKKNVGASTPEQKGYVMDYHDILQYTPPVGWRLPTAYEYKILNNYRINNFDNGGNRGYMFEIPYNSYRNQKIIFPSFYRWYVTYWCVGENGSRSIVDCSRYGFDLHGSINISACIRLVKE